MIIDLETTGLDPSQDEILEIGILMFGVVADENPFIVATYGSLNQPDHTPISEEITKITGIHPEHVVGAKIDWPYVSDLMRKCSLVVAHNAPFDRSFLLACPEISQVTRESTWACSLRHIDWLSKGFRSRSLQHLAADHGFLNPFPHRAIFDCATTFNLIKLYFSELTSKCEEHLLRILAWKSPFEKKDLLKEHGYRWNSEKRVWYCEVFAKKAGEEKAFLTDSIYGGNPQFSEEIVNIWDDSQS